MVRWLGTEINQMVVVKMQIHYGGSDENSTFEILEEASRP